MKKDPPKISTNLIEEIYLTHLEDDDDEMYATKEAIKEALTPFQRKIWITYVEEGSASAAARAFQVSAPTMSKYLIMLKIKIMEYVDNYFRTLDDKPDSDSDS